MNTMGKFVILTGLSGAGKSQAAHCFEDLDYFCVDNIPLELIPKFGELCVATDAQIKNVAMVLDTRGGFSFPRLFEILNELKTLSINYEILFLEAKNEVIIKRFSETRRKHPLSGEISLLDSIKEERKILMEIKSRSNLVINTSNLSPWQLKEKIMDLYSKEASKKRMLINVTSFGFKYGMPMDADLVFDVRFMPNPHYVDELRPFTGLDKKIVNYVMEADSSKNFKRRLLSFINFLIPEYVREGKAHLKIAIGCTGGKHRSVAMSEMIYKNIKKKNYKVLIKHKDISR